MSLCSLGNILCVMPAHRACSIHSRSGPLCMLDECISPDSRSSGRFGARDSCTHPSAHSLPHTWCRTHLPVNSVKSPVAISSHHSVSFMMGYLVESTMHHSSLHTSMIRDPIHSVTGATIPLPQILYLVVLAMVISSPSSVIPTAV